jgi:hypothetical protein
MFTSLDDYRARRTAEPSELRHVFSKRLDLEVVRL